MGRLLYVVAWRHDCLMNQYRGTLDPPPSTCWIRSQETSTPFRGTAAPVARRRPRGGRGRGMRGISSWPWKRAMRFVGTRVTGLFRGTLVVREWVPVRYSTGEERTSWLGG